MNIRDDLKGLPDPVHRYVKHVLGDEQRSIRMMRMTQSGELRTDPRRPRWMKFRAEHMAHPSPGPSPGTPGSGSCRSCTCAYATPTLSTVSLEFRFNDLAEVVGIHTEGRWNRTAKGYELTPWEGHFSGYRRHHGVLVPAKAEVGWYANGRLEIVWKGDITSLVYEFGPVG